MAKIKLNRKIIFLIAGAIGWSVFVGVVAMISRPKPFPPIQSPPDLRHSNNEMTNAPRSITLFVLDQDGFELNPHQSRVVCSDDTAEKLHRVMIALLETENAPFPNGTKIYASYIDRDGNAYLDFSRELADGHIGGTTAELLTISSILKTVRENFSPIIKSVQILIESGQEINTIGGQISISDPFSIE